MEILLRGIFGLAVLVGIAFLFSNGKRNVNWRIVGTGISLQVIFAYLVLKVEFVHTTFEFIASFFVAVINFSRDGAQFLFGKLVDLDSMGFIFAFQVLPSIIFFAALSSLLYYLGILQKIVYAFAWVMHKTMHLSGAETLSASANIFLGQTEAPLLIKPYVSRMTKSELMCVMTGGMATIAGGVMAGFIAFLGGNDPIARQFYATHLLSASIMSAPAAIVCAKLICPEKEYDKIDRELKLSGEKMGVNAIDALANGAADGWRMAINVGAMLLAFIAMIYMCNALLSWMGSFYSVLGIKITPLNELVRESTNGMFKEFNLQYLFGIIFRPVAFAMGTEWKDCLIVGRLLGEKTVINEFVGYLSLAEVKGLISKHSEVIAIYALCGFSNFSSIAIQIGGIGGMAPNQKETISRLGLRALLAGTLACLMTAAIAGMLVK